MAYEEDDTIPISLTILKKYGVKASFLFGEIWKQCESRTEHNCNDSYAELARKTGIPLRTVNRKMKEMLDDGVVSEVEGTYKNGIVKTYFCNFDKVASAKMALVSQEEYDFSEKMAEVCDKDQATTAKMNIVELHNNLTIVNLNTVEQRDDEAIVRMNTVAGQNVVPSSDDRNSQSSTPAKNAEVSVPNYPVLSEENRKEERFQKNKKMFLDKFYQNRTWDDENDFWLKVLFMRNENSQKKVYSDLYDAPKRFNGKEMTEYFIEVMKKYANVR